MNVLASSWRCLLAASVLAVLLAPAPLIAQDRDRPQETPKPAAKEGAERPGPEAKLREMLQHRRELEQKAAQIKEKLKSLRPDQDADAKELRAKLEAIVRELTEMPVPPSEPMRIHRRLAELKEQVRRAKEAGKHEEAERIEREARELMERLARPRGGRPPQAGEELERRMQHLRAAIDNLHAAGLHEEAEALARRVERLGDQWRERAERRPEGPSRWDAPFDRREGPPPAEQLQRSVAELRGQVAELRRQVEEIREALGRIAREKRGEK